MDREVRKILEREPIAASAPCRIDMGGTLDIATFYYPLRHLSPCTFNIALGLRTLVRLRPYDKEMVRISSSGFKDAQFPADAAPFDHPLGLMFATAAYFNARGIHIEIESQSPPRSALGGSSVAAVALVAALSKLSSPGKSNAGLNRRAIALLAYQIEQSVAGVSCGIQDQLAAAYGGVNSWYLKAQPMGPMFKKQCIVRKISHQELERHLLIAYCGEPHVSKDINGRWIRQFLSGRYRDFWLEITACTRRFAAALAEGNYNQAAAEMNRETAIRRTLTPDVLDSMGEKLVAVALQNDCGARFTGAGGGGCLWAIGEIENVDRLKPLWEKTLRARDEARLLEVEIDSKGLIVY
ncbi:MAG: galactokinase [Desulfobacterales bacterium]|jgi:D-glycero-alpha-D-manno-heptose-7-phosphate kinase